MLFQLTGGAARLFLGALETSALLNAPVLEDA